MVIIFFLLQSKQNMYMTFVQNHYYTLTSNVNNDEFVLSYSLMMRILSDTFCQQIVPLPLPL
jgi:hypothetical protein